MSITRAVVATILGSCLVGVGCVAAPFDSREENVMEAEAPIVIMNGDCPDYFWESSTIQELRYMAQLPISNGMGELVSNGFSGSPEGDLLLHYVVGCALPPGDSLKDTVSGITHYGAAGLAPDWPSHPMNDPETQRWYTACLLQTLNATCANVSIHMTGANGMLDDDPAEDVKPYSIADATMFGNLFAPAGPEAYACADKDLVHACGLGWSADAANRICDTSPTCQLTIIGECVDECFDDGLGNWICQDPSGQYWRQTISTTLTQTGFLTLYPECPL